MYVPDFVDNSKLFKVGSISIAVEEKIERKSLLRSYEERCRHLLSSEKCGTIYFLDTILIFLNVQHYFFFL